MKTSDRARGKWKGILLALGVDSRFLTGKHGPCPFCEGRDRFRWDNKDGNGTFFCSQCGAGDGIEFLKRLKGWDFRTAANEVDKAVGGASYEPTKPPVDPQKRFDMLNRLWTASAPIVVGDPVHAYFARRGVLPEAAPLDLRFAHACPVPYGGGQAPALIALVRKSDGEPANIHRTFLADPAPGEKRTRAMMPGDIPDGSAVRLHMPVQGRLGIAEGIETALAAFCRFGVPTWSAISSPMLAKWVPPEGVSEVVVFGDADPAYGGQSAAYALAHRLAVRAKLKVDVRIPIQLARDWADRDAE